MSEELQRVATPGEELNLLVTWSAALFLWAEEGENPGVKNYWDALHYIATSLSVGYANIFPVTPLGKTIGAVVQMIGPALSARALEGLKPSPSGEASGASRGGSGEAVPSRMPASIDNHDVVERLDAILAELRKRS